MSSIDQALTNNNQQDRVIKYILGKLESYAHKSHLWQIVHASHIRRSLLRKSRHISKLYSVSEDFVRQCIIQLLTDVDQCVTHLYRLICSEHFDDLITVFKHSDKINNAWHVMQVERARQIFSVNLNDQQITDSELLQNYYQYIEKKFTSKYNQLNGNCSRKCRDIPFDLNLTYSQAEHTAKNYLKNHFKKYHERQIPNIDLIDEMIKLVPLFFSDDDPSIIKLNYDLLSPESNIDQWTWLIEQWRNALRTLPFLLTKSGAFSRLVRTTIGIGLIYLGKSAETIISTDHSTINVDTMNEKLFLSLQIGFYFGIAYAFVDCFQDNINDFDKKSFSSFIPLNTQDNQIINNTNDIIDQWLLTMENILCGEEFDRNILPNTPFTTMLIDSFENLVILTQLIDTNFESLNELVLLLRSQRLDHKSFQQQYDNEQLYLGSILKSHYTYTCSTYLGQMHSARVDNDRIWLIPFLGQLTDDCRDFNDDQRSLSVTPFTYYAYLIKNRDSQVNYLINPFLMYLNICCDIYLSSNRDRRTGSFLGRRISRSLHSIEISKDEKALKEFLQIFCSVNFILFNYCFQKLRKHFSLITDPEKSFFRSLDLVSLKYSQTNRKLETFIFENHSKLENALQIDSLDSTQQIYHEDELLITAMNYSVQAGGKRLRMLLVLMIADLYQIEFDRILPLACGIEYLHTSSLIFDDLPAQDNSDLRRGRKTLHKTTIDNDIPENLSEGRAQLAGVDLIAISINVINNGLKKQGFSAERINQVIGEISLLMHGLCIGQMMDLRAARLGLHLNANSEQIDQLDRIAWLKTGKTIEAVLVTPAILSTRSSEQLFEELPRLRELSRLMGILFQMRDDLLDIEDNEYVGKPKSIDTINHTVTYVSLLGHEQTKIRLQSFLNQTLQLVDDCWPADAETIKDVVRYIVSRKN
ncbi:hypothetical protein I4U23_016496 [Adineta vaga]|nr:hypothetical protein I4U23_016496 [Adineta vaga]